MTDARSDVDFTGSKDKARLARRCAAYVRVSTQDQNYELQLRELNAFAAGHGGEVVEVYQDTASGARDRRPSLDRLIADATAKKFGCILVWKLV